MAEETPAEPPKLRVIAQFIRDLSFENIAAQKGEKMDGTPEITVQVSLDAKKLGGEMYEVTNRLKIDSNSDGKPVFVLELDYAGRFEISNVPDEQMHPFLLIECPRMIFPYLRRVVGDITRDGGYPPLNLDNIDFLALYRQEIARRQAQQPNGGTA
ncbi:MAG: protein-export chaperone SecB [Paracoccaceae bacterium]